MLTCGRAAQSCGLMFVPGGLRVGHRAGASGPTTWMHVNCMSAARWRTILPRTLDGFDSLALHDKAREHCRCEVRV